MSIFRLGQKGLRRAGEPLKPPQGVDTTNQSGGSHETVLAGYFGCHSMPNTQSSSQRAAPGGPDGPVADERQWRARTERMTVRPLGEGRYEVGGASGHHYLVSHSEGWCTCPDHLMRGGRCKHRQRVALEIAAGSVPGPDKRVTLCAACDVETAVEPAADPPLCDDCRLAPGTVAVDRETGDPVIVVEVLTDRADEVPILEAHTTVADYPGNREYPPRDPVVCVVYPGSIRPVSRGRGPPKRYAFPISRLRSLAGSVGDRPPEGGAIATDSAVSEVG